MSDWILKDWDGNIFISFENVDEVELEDCSQLTHCLAVVKIANDYLLGWNRWRNRWEVFGGCIDDGETARQCIIRECYEELGVNNCEIEYLGLMKFRMMPDYYSSEERIEYGGLYGISFVNISADDIRAQMNNRDEITKVALYSEVKNQEPIAPIDEKLLEYY